MNKPALIAGVVLLAAIAGTVAWREDGAARLLAAVGRAPAAAPVAAASAGPGAQWLAAVPDSQASELKRVPLPPVDSSAPAWLSMADARENGDPRTPPIQREPVAHNAPSAAELADPQAYQQYENDQHTKLLGAFVAAAATELPKLQADLERGRQAGIAPEQLAKVEEKIARIQRLSADIVKAQPQLQPAAGR